MIVSPRPQAAGAKPPCIAWRLPQHIAAIVTMSRMAPEPSTTRDRAKTVRRHCGHSTLAQRTDVPAIVKDTEPRCANFTPNNARMRFGCSTGAGFSALPPHHEPQNRDPQSR